MGNVIVDRFRKWVWFWKTMPISLLKFTTLMRSSKILSPSYMIAPSLLAPGIKSFMRLMLRKKVDFPQPDGPINAVIAFFSISNEM